MQRFEILRQIKGILTGLFHQEVKTPLSFFFRVAFYLAVIVVVAMVGGRPDIQEMVIVTALALTGIVIFAVISLTLWKPKNLTYGETGYRAEAKLAFGTEKTQISERELSELPSIKKPEGSQAIEHQP